MNMWDRIGRWLCRFHILHTVGDKRPVDFADWEYTCKYCGRKWTV